jgi:hypothetical protein
LWCSMRLLRKWTRQELFRLWQRTKQMENQVHKLPGTGVHEQMVATVGYKSEISSSITSRQSCRDVGILNRAHEKQVNKDQSGTDPFGTAGEVRWSRIFVHSVNSLVVMDRQLSHFDHGLWVKEFAAVCAYPR